VEDDQRCVLQKITGDRMKWLVFLFGLTACTTGIQYPDGGYPYPEHVSAKDTNFYYYPYRNALSRKDSFDYGSEHLLWALFKEPNLSLRPMSQETFRLLYSGWARRTYIILLKEKEITIKSGDNALVYEKADNAITKNERAQLLLLQRWFPLDEVKKYPPVNDYIDSMVKVYPQLLDPTYYQTLEIRSYTKNINNLHYTESSIAISREQFIHFVNLFNASGFWSMPFKFECQAQPTDGDGFSLEANTKLKYKIVHGCTYERTNFTKACQELVDFVHLDKDIHLFPKRGEKQVDSVVVKDVKLEEIKPERPKKHHRSSSK
jgi:hypothetical protein